MTVPADLRERIRLIALDLDGTTLTSCKRITIRTASVLRRAAKRYRLTFVTGRMLPSAAGFAAQLGFDLPLIVLNGSLISQGGADPLCCGRLDEDAVPRSLALTPPECSQLWMTRERLVTEPRWAHHLPYYRSWNDGAGEHQVPCAASALRDQPVYQLHWIGPPHAITPIAEAYASDHAVDRWPISAAASPLDHLEVRRAGRDKASGLRRLIADLGLTADQVLAFGDWLNDRPLMRAAGFGVAMQNAVPSVKALANHTLPHTCDEDGIARFIETHLL